MQPVTIDQETGLANYHGWESSWIFEKFYPVMLKRNGTIDYKLNPMDYSQKLDGGKSDVGNLSYDGNAMVCIEKFYTSFTMDGEDEVIRISPEKEDGFEAIGFINSSGKEVDKIFLPMYLSCKDNSNRVRSISDQVVYSEAKALNAHRTIVTNYGSGYDFVSWAMQQMLQAVYLILIKDCNPYTQFGECRTSYQQKTGKNNATGPISFDTSSKAMKFMHMEDFALEKYSNNAAGVGLIYTNSKYYVKMNPPYNTSSTSGYYQVPVYKDDQGSISKMACNNLYGRMAVEHNGSRTTYEAAYWDKYQGFSHCGISLSGGISGKTNRSNTMSPDEVNYTIIPTLAYLPPS